MKAIAPGLLFAALSIVIVGLGIIFPAVRDAFDQTLNPLDLPFRFEASRAFLAKMVHGNVDLAMYVTVLVGLFGSLFWPCVVAGLLTHSQAARNFMVGFLAFTVVAFPIAVYRTEWGLVFLLAVFAAAFGLLACVYAFAIWAKALVTRPA